MTEQKEQKLARMASKAIPAFIQEKMHLLTEKEQLYFRIMWAKYGVLFITAKPGVAKSAISNSICKKLGFRYMDIRLSMSDESDFKYPYLEDLPNEGKMVKVSGYAIPRWAYEANQQPTIIHFEELNRAPQVVRNAALQILLERTIGVDFKFNENVLMMASGNLGDEDSTDVEEFDSALNNRLIHFKHILTTDEWLEDFAKDNVHPDIFNYIKLYKDQIYKYSDGDSAYATPRSWTMLSEFIISNFGYESSSIEYLPLVERVSPGIVGNNQSLKFIKYLRDLLRITIDDVINDFNRVKEDLLTNFKRDKKSELIQSLKNKDLSKLNEKQLNNVANFLKTVDDDELTGYLIYILDENIDTTNKLIKNFLKQFKSALDTINEINNK